MSNYATVVYGYCDKKPLQNPRKKRKEKKK